MTHNTQKSDTAVNAEANALAALLNDGYLRIYDGTQPANANTAITSQTLLAELRFPNPAFGTAVAGVITANAITSDADANATGTASWYRCLESDGTTVVGDGSVGTTGSNCDMEINSTSISIHGTVSVSNFSITVPEHA